MLTSWSHEGGVSLPERGDPRPEQLDSGLLADLQAVNEYALEQCRRERVVSSEHAGDGQRPGAGLNHGQHDADQLGAFFGHESTRQLKLGVQQWDSVRGGHLSTGLRSRPEGTRRV